METWEGDRAGDQEARQIDGKISLSSIRSWNPAGALTLPLMMFPSHNHQVST
jgi:hypothetical protein